MTESTLTKISLEPVANNDHQAAPWALNALAGRASARMALAGMASSRRIKSALSLNIWQESRYFFLMSVGAVVVALSYSLFQVPHNIAAGGIGGLGIIINHFTGWPVGMLFLIMNIPLFVLGYFYLGRWIFIIRTVLTVFIFSIATDLFIAYLPYFFPEYPLTDDFLLNAVYAGLIGGVGGGLIYRAGSTMGGTGVVSRIIQQKTGIPLSQIYLYTDGGIVLAAAIIFGWEIALYAILTLILYGMACDYTLEGPGSVRTATIITKRPTEMSRALMAGLGRGNSRWQVTGSYTEQTHAMLMCTVYRPQVNDVKRIVADVDPQAFVTIGIAHQALGTGFRPLKHS